MTSHRDTSCDSVTWANYEEKQRAAKKRKDMNASVFHDTLKKCKTINMASGVSYACMFPVQARVHEASGRCVAIPPSVTTRPVQVRVHDGDCVAVAKVLCQKSDAKVWLLNMACPNRAGGGVYSGCNAQEEHLCRCSNLYPQLLEAQEECELYPLVKTRENGKEFTVLVHKQVTFFKDPSDYKDLSWQDWFCTGVLTAAAEKVSSRMDKIGPNAQRFIDFLLEVVHMQGKDCTDIILSAWGCGAFGQSAHKVATCFKQGLARFARDSFPLVTFAIIDDHNSDPPGNVQAFREVFVT